MRVALPSMTRHEASGAHTRRTQTFSLPEMVDDYDLEVDNLKSDKKRCQSLAGKLALDARIKVVIDQCAKFRRDNF